MKKSNWEYETCTRCRGTGHYSSHILYGTRCFKCGCAKTTITRRGRAAEKYYFELVEKDATKVKVGDRIYRWKRGWWKIENIEYQSDNIIFNCEEEYTVVAKNTETIRSASCQEELDEKVAKAQEYQAVLGKHGKVLKKYAEAWGEK